MQNLFTAMTAVNNPSFHEIILNRIHRRKTLLMLIYVYTSQNHTLNCNRIVSLFSKAMPHGAIFLATCNAILLLRDVNLANARLHYILLIFVANLY